MCLRFLLILRRVVSPPCTFQSRFWLSQFSNSHSLCRSFSASSLSKDRGRGNLLVLFLLLFSSWNKPGERLGEWVLLVTDYTVYSRCCGRGGEGLHFPSHFLRQKPWERSWATMVIFIFKSLSLEIAVFRILERRSVTSCYHGSKISGWQQ